MHSFYYLGFPIILAQTVLEGMQSMSPDIRSRRSKREANAFKKLSLVIKANHIIQLAFVFLVIGIFLLSISGMFIQPFVSQESSSINLTNDTHIVQQGTSSQLNLYAEAPNYPIYLNISNPSHQTLTYSIYFINDTNQAIGIGPKKLIMTGTFNNSIDLVIPNTVYHMTYTLKITASNQTFFEVPVSYTQTLFQYPPYNIFLLAPGIMTIVAGISTVGMRLINVHSDRDLYYSNLKLENSELQYLMERSSIQIDIPWFGKSILGLVFTVVGFTVFGSGIVLSWVGIILILTGVAFILNGLVQRATKR